MGSNTSCYLVSDEPLMNHNLAFLLADVGIVHSGRFRVPCKSEGLFWDIMKEFSACIKVLAFCKISEKQNFMAHLRVVSRSPAVDRTDKESFPSTYFSTKTKQGGSCGQYAGDKR